MAMVKVGVVDMCMDQMPMSMAMDMRFARRIAWRMLVLMVLVVGV
jgi:hypothetical protein